LVVFFAFGVHYFCVRAFPLTVFRFSARFEASAGNLPETRSERQTYIEKKEQKI
jgi:hypothetical protein